MSGGIAVSGWCTSCKTGGYQRWHIVGKNDTDVYRLLELQVVVALGVLLPRSLSLVSVHLLLNTFFVDTDDTSLMNTEQEGVSSE